PTVALTGEGLKNTHRRTESTDRGVALTGEGVKYTPRKGTEGPRWRTEGT
ncbi:hypothetical protein NDU88_000201, partial [Pleurodeles waltl]